MEQHSDISSQPDKMNSESKKTRRRPSLYRRQSVAMRVQRHLEEIIGKRRLYTALILYAFATMGICFNILSPSLRDLAVHWNTTSDRISEVYTYRSSGYTVGALLAGFLYMKLNRQLTVSIMLAIMGITLSLVPLLESTGVAFPLLTLNGLTSGICDTGFNVWMIDLWKASSGPMILALWFSFSVGSSIAPLMVAPYLSQEHHHQLPNSTQTNDTLDFIDDDPVNSIFVPYAVSGFLIFIGGLMLHIAYWVVRYTPELESSVSIDADEVIQDGEQPAPVNNDSIIKAMQDETSKSLTISEPNNNRQQTQSGGSPFNRWHLILVIAASTLLITAYSAMEICHFQFLPLYLTAIRLYPHHLTTRDASYIASALSISHTVVRGAGIFVAIKLKPSFFLYIDLGLMLVANCLLLLFSSSSVGMIWAGNILLGVAFGTFFPSIFAYVERLIVISDMVGGIFLFSSGVTSAFLPLLIGGAMDTEPDILIYSNLVLTGVCILSLLALQTYLVKYNRTATHKVPVLG